MEKVATWLRPAVETYLNKNILLDAFFLEFQHQISAWFVTDNRAIVIHCP